MRKPPKHPKTRGVLLLLLTSAVLAASLYLVPLADGGQEPPAVVTGKAAQDFLRAAQKQRAKVIFPKDYASAEDDLKRARFEMNLQLSTLWGTRDFARPTRLMDQAQASAFNLFWDAAEHQRETRAMAEQAIADAAGSLAESHRVAKMSLPEAYVNAKLAAAKQKLHEARSCQADCRYDEALESALRSRKESAVAGSRSRQILARFDDPHSISQWQTWVSQAIAYSNRTGGVAFVVIKERHRLDAYRGGRLVRSVPVDLGANFVSQKVHAGDRATPEGFYHISQKKGYGATKYNLALLLDYPNSDDRHRFSQAKERGELTRRTGIGGLIEIHGDGGRGYDWTDGCVAPSDEDMKLLYNMASVGMPVAIVGSDGTEGPVRSMLREQGDRIL